MIALSSMANAGEFRHFSDWTPEKKAEVLLYTGISYVDYSQTTWAMRQNDRQNGVHYRELNPILGSYPSNESIALLSLLSVGYYYYLVGNDSKYPKLSIAGRSAMFSVKIVAITYNNSIGISVSKAW